MNVLFTCAGRRNLLLQYFRRVVRLQGGEIYAADASPDAPALQEAGRAFIVHPIDHPDYFDQLFDLCRQHQIRLLISLNDLEIPLLAEHRQHFLEIGTIIVVSSPQVVNTCFDKWETHRFLQRSGLAAPGTYLSLPEARQGLKRGEVNFPLVLKPRWGTASIAVEYVKDKDELAIAYQLVKKRIRRSILARVSAGDIDRSVLIQEKISGQEYVIDVINDLNGRYVTTFVKRKLSNSMNPEGAMRVELINHKQLEAFGETLGRRLGHIGNLDCDVFVHQGRCYALDLNPRFGGGYPFTHLAGANVPAALVAWAKGEIPDPDWFRIEPGTKVAKFEQVVLIDSLPAPPVEMVRA